MTGFFAALELLGITSKLGKFAAVALAIFLVAGSLVAGYAAWRHSIWKEGHNAGYTEAINAIAAQDGRAIGAAKDARRRVADCRAGGLRWNQSTGECEGR